MDSECVKLHAELVKARMEVLSLEGNIRRRVAKVLPDEVKHGAFLLADLHIGDFWDCPDSPTGHCVYDRYRDPAMDNCLFCHEPAERK